MNLLVEAGLEERFTELCKKAARHRGFGDFWGHVLVAQGSMDVMLDPVVEVWDVAALKIIVGSMGVCVAVIAGIVSLYRFQENWIEYRATAESLKHEKFLFLTKSPPYEGENSFHAFVSNVESLISKENTNWSGALREKPKTKDQE